MKFLSLALLATPALTQSLKEALNAAPLGKMYADQINGDQKAQDTLVPPGKSMVTLFLPTDKALQDHRSNAPHGKKSKRALQPGEYETAGYSSTDGKMNLAALSLDGILKTQSVDATTGKQNDMVAEGTSNGKIPARLMPRAGNATTPDITMFGGLGARAKIVAGDFVFDKGVIHFVDTVLEVPKRCSVTINSLGYTNFQNALTSAGLLATIDMSTTTLFAYDDSVFTASADKSAATLKQHIVPNFIAYTPTLDTVQVLTTAGNATLKVSFKNGQYFINDSPIVRSNSICNNGVVHTLGKLLTNPVVPFNPISDAASSRVNQMTIAGTLFLVAWNYLV
ncbi:FAS1 domain-containing protein [Choiromyces venosus 120613-1]|uniref:FAS1 domain-containing protein n=1 Tax=Choiromyces venosus 120613-1 TaxID=1336337 RepID=A0A3N4IWH3_9PEZI|nr:FAS1 domain-containing protein [Choiromyces venosus 120613-1]